MAIFRLSAAAEADIVRILGYSQDQFGKLARLRYEALIVASLRDLAADPMRPASADRPELGFGVRSYHLRHSRERAWIDAARVRRPRHFLLYRFTRPDLVGIGRVLHEGMEIARHLPDGYGDE